MKAFSLLEMLVSISVLVILAGLILFVRPGAPQTYELLNAAQRIEAELRKVQGFAVAAKDFKGATPPGGWGIHFQVGLPCYIIFADLGASPNERYDPGVSEQADICNTAKSDPATERFERVYFPSTIKIKNDTDVSPATTFTGAWGPGNGLDVIYQPPLLKVFFNNTLVNSGQLILTSIVGDTKTITINSVGNVIIQ